MQAELVSTTTADGIRLHGMLQLAAAGAREKSADSLGIDAALCIHGTGSNFYSSTLFDVLGQRFLEAGVAVLRINTRGHDAVSTAHTESGGVRQGAAFEIMDDCRHDLTAWTGLLVDRGLGRIAVVGHSSGAVKGVYWLADSPPAAVKRLVAISPPLLSHERFLASQKRDEFARDLGAAEAAIAAGEEDKLLDVRFPLPHLISARGYLDKYGPAERYNLLRLLPRVQVPVLVTFGGAEVRTNVAFRGLPEAIESLPVAAAPRRVSIVAEADHFYSSARKELSSQVLRWLSKTSR